jgi:hypothetical protein
MRIAAALAAGGFGFLLSTASFAKEIPPGALHVCGADHCRAVSRPADARAFSALLWGQGRIRRAPTPPVGAPVFQLRYWTGPAGAIITTTSIRVRPQLRPFSARGKWYRLPQRLRGLTDGLEPRRLTGFVPRSC